MTSFAYITLFGSVRLCNAARLSISNGLVCNCVIVHSAMWTSSAFAVFILLCFAFLCVLHSLRVGHTLSPTMSCAVVVELGKKQAPTNQTTMLRLKWSSRVATTAAHQEAAPAWLPPTFFIQQTDSKQPRIKRSPRVTTPTVSLAALPILKNVAEECAGASMVLFCGRLSGYCAHIGAALICETAFMCINAMMALTTSVQRHTSVMVRGMGFKKNSQGKGSVYPPEICDGPDYFSNNCEDASRASQILRSKHIKSTHTSSSISPG